MNQPTSSCVIYYNEVVCINKAISAANHLPHNSFVASTTNDPIFDHEHASVHWWQASDLTSKGGPPLEDTPPNQSTATTLEDPSSVMDTDDPGPHVLWSKSPFVEMYPGTAQTFGQGETFMNMFDADRHAEN
jgi:hypothetical protein